MSMTTMTWSAAQEGSMGTWKTKTSTCWCSTCSPWGGCVTSGVWRSDGGGRQSGLDYICIFESIGIITAMNTQYTSDGRNTIFVCKIRFATPSGPCRFDFDLFSWCHEYNCTNCIHITDIRIHNWSPQWLIVTIDDHVYAESIVQLYVIGIPTW